MEQVQVNRAIKRGLIWTTVNRLSVIVVQFVAMIVLARYLLPSDFALIGIVMFFISISAILTDSGMGASLIVKKNVRREDYDTLFVYNLVVGVAMYLLFVLSSDMLSSFYKIAELSSIINVIGMSIVISALGKIQNTILVKELKFKELGIISIVSSTFSLACAVILAIVGYGVWSLVIQNLLQVSLTLLLQFYYNRFIPRLKFSSESFKEQWGFGVHLFLSLGMRTIYTNIFLAIFPKLSTLNFSGLYSQANKIQQIPVSVFTEVIDKSTFPVLSKIKDMEQFKEVNRSVARKLYMITFFCFLLLSLLSAPVINILLGDKWVSASPILSIISYAGIGLIVMAVVRNTLKSISKTKQIFYLEIWKTVIGFIVLIISIFAGKYGIIWGIFIASILSSIVSVYLLAKHTNYTVLEQLNDILSSLVVMIPGFVGSYILLYVFDFTSLIALLVGIGTFTVLTLVSGVIMRNNEMIFMVKKCINIIWQ